jgi:cobalt-zinc-cadmium efflux system membrane fusion protein
MAGIEFGNLEKKELSGDVAAKGKIVLPPQSKALVSPVMGGVVETIKVMPGEQVKKGDILALLMHPAFTSLQEEYIQAVNHFELIESEFQRQQKLFEEKVTSEKKLLETKTEYQSLKAQIASLEMRLGQAGLSTEKISRGKIEAFIPVRSPIDGIVNSIFTNIGANANENNPLFEVVCRRNLYVELSVFEKDIMKIRKGQRVTFGLSNIDNEEYEASVIAVGGSVEEMGRVVKVLSEFKNQGDVLLPGMFVAAEIHTGEEEFDALPESAIMNFGSDQTYIYYTSSGLSDATLFFEKAFVKTGFAEEGFIQIVLTEALPSGALVVINGGYYLRAEEMKNKE